MARLIWVIGKMERLMEKADLFMVMVMFMREIGLKTRLKVMGFIIMQMELNTLEIG